MRRSSLWCATFLAQAAVARLYLQTNWEAPRGRIMVADLAHPDRDHLKVLVPEGPGTIENFHAVGGMLLVNYMKDVHSELDLYDIDGKRLGGVPLPGLGSVSVIDGQWNSSVVCFSYSSFQAPTTFFSYFLDTGKLVELSAPKVPARLREVEVEQVWYSSKDGTKVPMFIVHKKNFVKNDDGAVLLYGYGDLTGRSCPPSRRRKPRGWNEAESMPSPTFVAGTSLVKPGTKPDPSQRNRTASTTSPRPPSGCSTTITPSPAGLRFRA